MVVPHPRIDTYALLTRPPLTGLPLPVRLACVKHAASVRSEPGSNSQVHLSLNTEAQGPRSRSINEQTRTLWSVPVPGDVADTDTETAFKAYCNASKRHAIARPQSQTNEIQVLLETQTAGPAARSALRSRTRPEGAANVSLPSLCNCQRPERNRPQPRNLRAYRLTCSDVRRSGRRTETLA